MDNKKPIVSDVIKEQNSLESASPVTDNNFVSQYANQQGVYSAESIEVNDGTSGFTPKPETAVYTAADLKLNFSKRKAMVVSIVITLLVGFISFGSLSLLIKKSDNNHKAQQIASQQDINLKDADNSKLPPELQGAGESLIVSGDLITRGDIKIVNSGVITTLTTNNSSNRTLNLPDASGTFCLDSNNCQYATQAQLGQIVAPPASLVNGVAGALTIQGSTNQITVNTSGGVVTISTPQNLDANANVQFNSLTVSPTGQITTNKLVQTTSGNNVSIDAGSDMISLVAGGRTFQLPTTGPASQTICTTGATCASGSGAAVILAPTSVQNDGSADDSIFINDTAGGALLHLQTSGVDELVVANNGDTTVSGSLTATSFTGVGANITNLSASNISSGTLAIARIADASLTNVKLQNSSLTVTAGNGLINGGSVSLGGSTVLDIGAGDGITVNANDIAVDASVCRTSGNCVGVGGSGDILQGGNSFGATMTIGTNDAQSLALETSGLARLTISSTGDASFSGTITAGTWNGTAIGDVYLQDNITVSNLGTVDWTALSNYPASATCAAGSAVTQIADAITCAAFAAGSGSGNYIQNQSGTDQTADFRINGTGRANTALQTPLLDTATATVLNIGTTNATQINLNKNVVVASGQKLTIVGGNTASRAGLSPTEGAVYYDTDTKQLLTYANGKWQADRGDAIYVATSNSSQADRDRADYVGDGNTGAAGDGDQVEINSALTAASGKKVILLAGTYTIDAGISVPNNTTLSGVGHGTLITIPNSFDTDINAVTNTTTGGNGTGIVIQDLRLDGNRSNQASGNMNGVYMNGAGSGSGASAIQGAKIMRVWAVQWRSSGSGINLTGSSNSILEGNTVLGNNNTGIILSGASTNNILTGNIAQGNGAGFYISSDSNTITGNTAQGNSSWGFVIARHNNTITGNTAQGNNTGLSLAFGTNNTITGNTFQTNTSYGIDINTGGDNNVISGNKFHDNGGVGNNNAISVSASDNNTITGNSISDTSCGTGTTNCYGINIVNVSSDNNYLADNYITDTDGDATAGINDLGTGTIFGGQANGSTNFVIQPAGTVELMKNTNITGNLAVTGTGSFTGGSVAVATTTATEDRIVLAVATGGAARFDGTITNGVDLTAARTWRLPDATGTICLDSSVNNCSYLTTSAAATGYIQNQTSTDQTADFRISGTGRANTSVLTPLLDTASAVVLNIGTTNATQINLNKNVVVAASQSLTITGGASGTRPGSPAKGMLYFDTTTNQLLQWNGGKWMSDRATATKIVASNTSSQAMKDAADYVADGTSDQVEINAALAAAAGGTVYVAEGLYTVDGTILVPDNTTLAGANKNTSIIRLSIGSGSDNLIENSNTSNGFGVVIRDLWFDNVGATGGTQNGIYLRGLQFGNTNSQLINLISSWSNGSAVIVEDGTLYRLTDSSILGPVDVKGVNSEGRIELFTGSVVGSGNLNLTAGASVGANASIGTFDHNELTGNLILTGSTGYAGINVASDNTFFNNVTINSTATLSSIATFTGNLVNGNLTLTGGAASSLINNLSGNQITGNVSLTSSIIYTVASNSISGNLTLSAASGVSNIVSFSGNRVAGTATLTATGSGAVAIDTFTGNRVTGAVTVDGSGGGTVYIPIMSGNVLSNVAFNTVTLVPANISGNSFYPTTANAIALTNADNFRITSNQFSNLGGGTNAVNINNTSDNTYLADNDFGSLALVDSSTTTKYGGQTNAAGNFVIQPAGTIELMKNTNVTGNLAVTGTGSFTGGSVTVATTTATEDRVKITVATGGAARFDGTITNADLTAARTWTLPNQDGTFCLSTNNCTGLGAYIQNQNAGAQSTSNFWISGTGRADTALITPALRPTTDSTTALKIQNASGGSDVLTVDTTNSRIGIGVTPTVALDVNGAANISSLATVGDLQVGSSASTAILFTPGAGNQGIEIGRTDSAAGSAYIDFHTGNATPDYNARIVVSGGNSTDGSGTLQILAATVAVPNIGAGNGANAACLSAGGSFLNATTTCTNPSSIAYKENVQTIQDPMSIINQLRSVSFDWKSSTRYTAGNGGSQDFGFIAQEVNAVLPQLVQHDENGTIIGLDYLHLVPFTVGAIQQQQVQIDNMQVQLNSGQFNQLIVAQDASIGGNLTVVGNISTHNITVNGHIITAGNTPQIVAGTGAGAAATVQITGNDTSGTVTISTGSGTTADTLANITFAEAFSTKPRIVITAANRDSAKLHAYYDATNTTVTGFSIMSDSVPEANKVYSFTYYVVE